MNHPLNHPQNQLISNEPFNETTNQFYGVQISIDIEQSHDTEMHDETLHVYRVSITDELHVQNDISTCLHTVIPSANDNVGTLCGL